MKYLYLLLATLTLSGNFEWSFPPHRAQLKGLFGFQMDSLSNPEIDSLLIENAKSILIKHHPIDTTQISIIEKGKFQNLQGVYFCWFREDGVYSEPESPIKLFFFNKNTNNVYHYGGDLKGFNGVFCHELRNNLSSSYVLELLTLYFHTRTELSMYCILSSVDDFNNDYDQFYNFADSSHNSAKINYMRNEKLQASNIVTAPKWQKDIGFYLIDFYTLGGNDLEHWVFRAYDDSLNIAKHEVIMKNMGPYLHIR